MSNQGALVSGLKPAISSLAKPIYLKEHALHAVKEAIITHQLSPMSSTANLFWPKNWESPARRSGRL
jgi:hypothetical protein